ncbi:MAG: hypothetical protein SFY56_06250 [Bacteroidota bacterium]|nr:hypothetical protein [Bacteroidota bacterium]
MKKVMIIVAVASLAFASCKKERVCECVFSSDAPGSVSSTYKVTVKKAKKDVCDKNSNSSITTAPVAGTYTYKTECTLK